MIYTEIKANFRVRDSGGKLIESFSRFLKAAISNDAIVFLEGSGEFAGLSFRNAELEYNLRNVSELTKYWDIHTGRKCGNCEHGDYYYINQYTREGRCERGYGPMNPNKCREDFSPKFKCSGGKAPRNLEKLIQAESK